MGSDKIFGNWCILENRYDFSVSLNFLKFQPHTHIWKDKCCRTHDYCTHWIGSFERKWNLFNWNIYTIMDCKCDKRYITTQLLFSRSFFSLRKILFADLTWIMFPFCVDWLLFLLLMKMWKLKKWDVTFLCVNYFLHPSPYNALHQIHKKSLFSLSDVWNLSSTSF